MRHPHTPTTGPQKAETLAAARIAPGSPKSTGYTGYTGYTTHNPLKKKPYQRNRYAGRTGDTTRTGYTGRRPQRIDFAAINRAALPHLPTILARWLPGGRIRGAEYVARNPTRSDRRPGSFCINIRTCRWADFATEDRGGDVVSLAAYIHRLDQGTAARQVCAMLGMEVPHHG